MIADYLFNPKNKEEIQKALHANIDIPIIGEKTEAKIISAIWDTVEAVFRKALLK